MGGGIWEHEDHCIWASAVGEYSGPLCFTRTHTPPGDTPYKPTCMQRESIHFATWGADAGVRCCADALP
jgi:hypothetical protein